jgi:hypothetical protein
LTLKRRKSFKGGENGSGHNIESEVKMADDLGSIAWSFLPENEQVQYLQKIALRAENPSGSQSNSEKGRKDEKDEKWISRSRITRI